MSVEITCQNCSEVFEVYPCEVDEKKYCSMACMREHQRNRIPPGKTSSNCEECGEEFYYYPDSTNHRGRFCSSECYGKYQSPTNKSKVVKSCKRCGKEFRIAPSMEDRRKYCSKECRKKLVNFFGQPLLRECDSCGLIKSRECFPSYGTGAEISTSGKCLDCLAEYKQMRRSKPGSYTRSDIIRQWHKQNGCCFWCGHRCGNDPTASSEFHVDHLTPLSRADADPTHYKRNLVISCAECNYKKSDQLPIEFKLYRLKHSDADSTYLYGSTVDLSSKAQ